MNSNAIKTPVKISSIVIHLGSHFDEAVGRKLLLKHGQTLFPGIENARLTVSRDLPTHGDDYYDPLEMLPLGCGGGRFDEHRSGDIERLDNKCCAILVAEYLGVQNLPHYQKLLEETLECDTHNVGATMFPQVMKVYHETFAADDQFVLKQVDDTIDCIIQNEICRYATSVNTPTLVSVFEKVLVKRKEFNEKSIIEQIRGHFAESDKNRDKRALELSSILRAMHASKKPTEEMEDWVWFVTRIMYTYQVNFLKAKAFCKENAEEHFARIGQYEQSRVRIGFVKSDSTRVLSAMLYLQFDVIMIQNSRGNIQVCVSKKFRENGGLLTNFLRMWRWLELPIREKIKYTWSDLGAKGHHPGTNNIYYHDDAGNIYNGSTTHPGIKPTGVSPQALLEALRHSFTEGGMEVWFRGRNINLGKDCGNGNSSRPRQPLKDEQLAVDERPLPGLPFEKLDVMLKKRGIILPTHVVTA